jgi:hypothetical protein
MKLPFFDAFNSPDNVSSCAARDSTVVPSQALALLNGQDTLQHARALAGQLWRRSHGNTASAASLAWMTVFGRRISEAESRHAAGFLDAREAEWTKTAPAAAALPTGLTADAPMPAARGAAWVEWCLALLNSNEFVYVD